MSQPHPPPPVKLVASLLFREEADLAAVLAAAQGLYGPVDFLSELLPFDFTPYYDAEMGKGLWRRVAGFAPLVSPERLVQIKRTTNQWEQRHLNPQGGRRINIDPGYVAASKFVLATGKDYSHRVYLGEGIFADLTLIYQKGSFTPLPWTYPDYASQPLIGILNLLRRRYMWQQNPKCKGG